MGSFVPNPSASRATRTKWLIEANSLIDVILATTYPLTLPLKPIALGSAALVVVLLATVLQLPFVAMAIPILVILIVQVADRTLGTAFLILASLHATYSYLSAAVGGVIGVHPDSNTEAFLLEAYKVYCFGICQCLSVTALAIVEN